MRVDLREALGRRATAEARARTEAGAFLGRQEKSPTELMPPQRIVFPPYVYKIPGESVDFGTSDYASTLPAGQGSTVVPVQFALPGTMKGWVQIFGIYVLTPTALADITWTLRINAAPVSGWSVDLPSGVANLFVQNFSDVQVEAAPGVVIDVIVTNNNANGPWTVGATLRGWYHSEDAENRWFGNV